MEKLPLATPEHPWNRIFVSLVYLALLLPVLATCIILPSMDTFSETYSELYYSRIMEFGKLAYLLLALGSGFVYVLMVTLNGKRSSSVESSITYDFVMCLEIGCILHFLGSNATLLGWSDSTSWITLMQYDFLTWTTAFWIGLHYTYLDSGDLKKLILKWDYMKNWSAKLWVIFSVSSVTGVSLAAYQLYLLEARGLLIYFAIGYGLVIFGLLLVAVCTKNTHDFHLHHYQLFSIVIPLTMNQTWVSAACQGLSFGVFCEGLARWGSASCFEKKS